MFACRPTRAEIDLQALCHNFRLARQQAGPDCGVLAVVKADAYGHGAPRVAAALAGAGAELFGVALVDEALALREAGITRPILVLGQIFTGQEEAVLRGGIHPVLFSLETARRLAGVARRRGLPLPYHLKIDTGMGRVGFTPAELPATLTQLAALPELVMEGVLSHLALADAPGHPLIAQQVARFEAALGDVRQAGFAPRYVHLGNSAALFSLTMPGCNLVRPGITLYGALPSEDFADRLDLRPVMSLRTRIVHLKDVPAGTGISYGHHFVTDRPSRIASLPIGYADGYNRLLSNRGEVLVGGRRAPVAGTVCMDWTMIDVTDLPGVAVGDEVTLLGADGGDCISAEEWAGHIGTISYEVFCGISKRVPRVYREEKGEGSAS